MQSENQILLASKSAAEALNKLYAYRKRQQPKFSLAYICRRANISSKGYLSDVLKGKRTLNAKYHDSICSALALNTTASRYLNIMLTLEQERDPKRTQQLTDKLSRIRKTLGVSRLKMPAVIEENFFQIELFCAFGLFHNKPTLEQLLKFFGRDRHALVKDGLQKLLLQGYIVKTENHFSPITQNISFEGGDQNLGHIAFLKAALEDAKRNVEQWFEKRDEAYFDSLIISVNAKHYQKELYRLKEDCREHQANWETAEADALVRFNIQVYPIAKEKFIP